MIHEHVLQILEERDKKLCQVVRGDHPHAGKVATVKGFEMNVGPRSYAMHVETDNDERFYIFEKHHFQWLKD